MNNIICYIILVIYIDNYYIANTLYRESIIYIYIYIYNNEYLLYMKLII